MARRFKRQIRDKVLGVKVSPGEMKLIEDLAEAQNLTKSELLRDHILLLVEKALQYRADKKLAEALDPVISSATEIITYSEVDNDWTAERDREQLKLWTKNVTENTDISELIGEEKT